jgi:hypothetical protein
MNLDKHRENELGKGGNGSPARSTYQMPPSAFQLPTSIVDLSPGSGRFLRGCKSLLCIQPDEQDTQHQNGEND